MKRVPFVLALALAVTGALFSQAAPAHERAAWSSSDRLESKLLERLNALRERRGLSLLRVSAQLSSAADRHTNDMARNGFCGHQSTAGVSFWKRISRHYGRGTNWRSWSVAENVLCHPRRLTAAAALRRWLASPGHRSNVLSSHWRDVGLAAIYAEPTPGRFAGQDVLYVTAAFGVRS